MSQYFLVKTGWQFFDVSRAYGLGVILHALCDDATITDKGWLYQITTKNEPNLDRIHEIARFLGNDQNWRWTLLTIGNKQVVSTKERVANLLMNRDKINSILNSKATITHPDNIGKGDETLYQSMELAATKGFRVEVLLKGKYTEGTPIKIPQEEFCLSVLGHLNATIWRLSNLGMIFATPLPQNTRIFHLIREINRNITESVRGVHRAGWFPSIAHIAINLVLEEVRVREGRKFSPQFSSIIYGIMTKTGNQWKPLTGGIFPLDFLHQIANSKNSEIILNNWDKIFNWTAFRKGYEDIATALAEFIGNPTLTTYERYVKLHLRNELSKDRIKFGSYEKEILEEVISNVRI